MNSGFTLLVVLGPLVIRELVKVILRYLEMEENRSITITAKDGTVYQAHGLSRTTQDRLLKAVEGAMTIAPVSARRMPNETGLPVRVHNS